MHVYLARHGETEWNVEGRMQGRKDSPLTLRGVEQAQDLARALERVPLDAAYASPSPRALRTAQIACRDHDVPVVPAPDLAEIALGAWEGQLVDEVQGLHPEAYRAYRTDPAAYRSPVGGETVEEVRARVLAFVRALVGKPPGEHVLLVSHTVPIKLLLGELDGRPLAALWDPPRVEPGSLVHVLADSAGMRWAAREPLR